MPQQNDYLSFTSDEFVSDIDYSEARTILDLTTTKQKQLRGQRSQPLFTQVLLKRTYVHVCELLNSECSVKKSLPLSTIDTNKRKLSSIDDHQVPSINKKSKSLMDNDILQFLHELNAVKVLPSDHIRFSSYCSSNEENMPIVFVVWINATQGVIVPCGNGQGNTLDQFDHPTAVLVDQWEILYIVGYYNYRVIRSPKKSEMRKPSNSNVYFRKRSLRLLDHPF